jgi:predicted ester cyclase
MSEQAKTVVRRLREEAISAGDFALFDRLVAPDVVYRGPILLPEVRGREPFKQAIAGFRQVLPDLRETVEAQWADGEWVTTRFHTTGTHLGGFMGGEPTGNRLEGWGLDVSRVVDGRLVEMWAMFDALAMLQAFGVVSLPGEG